MHVPVLLEQVVDALSLSPGKTIVDCTLGSAGHAREILKRITPGGRLIGIDQDQDAIQRAAQQLWEYKDSITLVNDNFKNIGAILAASGVEKIDGALLDLGVSSEQFGEAERGFSIKYEGPLDMRMDKNQKTSAYDLVNKLSKDELSMVFKEYGEERFHERIARAIVEKRRQAPIRTTLELADIVSKAVPQRMFYRIHPATKVFQALRIAVNKELEAPESTLEEAIKNLSQGARICVISYHSLEDRIVKNKFRDLKKQGVLDVMTKKPVTPDEPEIKNNPRSRSAKLRVAQRRAA